MDLHCDVAGQFFPRRDTDWYEFDAKKGMPIWIELQSERLGTTCDAILRVRKKSRTDSGEAEFVEIATVDDVQGRPNSRSTRRMFSGSGDARYRLVPDEDATYQVAVRDQYNTSTDDPRLVYRLCIHPERVDYRLLAFADPERNRDQRQAQPNGVSIMPGGTTHDARSVTSVGAPLPTRLLYPCWGFLLAFTLLRSC